MTYEDINDRIYLREGVINMIERRISSKELKEMVVLKRDIKTKIPKVLMKDGIIYKLEPTHIASRLKPLFEVFNEIHELSDCIFPEGVLYIDSKEFGYTTKYLDGYKNISNRLKKDKMSLEWKKAIIYKIIKLIKNLHLNGLVHNDLHGSNILNINADIKLIDFDQIKIKKLESNYMYMAWLKMEINYLNLLILSVLYEVNLSYINNETQQMIIEELEISREFKEYLNNCLLYKENAISNNLEQYVNSITKRDIVNGKNLVKSLKI